MSIDWTKSMQQTYEYYEVDPHTWQNKRKLTMFTSSSIERDTGADTLGSASFDVTENLGECYVRTYLVANQNGSEYKVPVGTYLVSTPGESFDGKVHTYSLDGYSPLKELKETQPPLGYTIQKGTEILSTAYKLTREHTRATVVEPTSNDSDNDKMQTNFVANDNDTWFTFLTDLLATENYHFAINPLGEIMFEPYQDIASLQPRFTYDDDNSSILLPSISIDRDIYSIPNVIEVIYSYKNGNLYSRMSNRDDNSPISVQNRGREIVQRITNPQLPGTSDQHYVDQYCMNQLKSISALSYQVKYEHGYNETNIRDCVRLNYKRSGLNGVKVMVMSQSVKCSTGCTVSETSVYTENLCGLIRNDYSGEEVKNESI